MFCLKVVGQAVVNLDPSLLTVLSDVEAAIAVLKHSADEDAVREKMKATFSYRHSMVNDEKRTADVFSVFPRFLDTPGSS